MPGACILTMLLVLTSAFIPTPYPLSSCSLQCPLCLQASVSSCVRRAASTGPTSTAPAPAAEAVARGLVDAGYSQLTGVSLRTRSRPWSGPRLASARAAACDAPLLCTPLSRGARRRITRGAHTIKEFTRSPPRIVFCRGVVPSPPPNLSPSSSYSWARPWHSRVHVM